MEQAADITCLTPLERQIVNMVGEGFRDWHIDDAMWMTRQLLREHLHSIFGKLGVTDQGELAQLAVHLSTAGSHR